MKKNKWRIFLVSIKWLWIKVELTEEDENYGKYDDTRYSYTHLFIDYTRTFVYDRGLDYVIKEFIDDLNDKRTNFYDSNI